MNYGNVLPVTGGAGTLIGLAIAVVLLGITAYRFGARIGQGSTTVFLGVAAWSFVLAVITHMAGMSWLGAVAIGAAAATVALAAIGKIVTAARRHDDALA